MPPSLKLHYDSVAESLQRNAFIKYEWKDEKTVIREFGNILGRALSKQNRLRRILQETNDEMYNGMFSENINSVRYHCDIYSLKVNWGTGIGQCSAQQLNSQELTLKL